MFTTSTQETPDMVKYHTGPVFEGPIMTRSHSHERARKPVQGKIKDPKYSNGRGAIHQYDSGEQLSALDSVREIQDYDLLIVRSADGSGDHVSNAQIRGRKAKKSLT